MRQNRIYLSPPDLNGYEMDYIKEAFDTNWIAPLGPNVDAFEKEVAQQVGVKHAAALSSGTAAIHLSLKYLGVGQGDHIFCSSLTFSGSCNPILYEKAIPVFIDSEPATWNMSPEALEKAFAWAKKNGSMPKAVIIVNLYGQSADWDKLLPICEYYGVPVIEDSAESLGAQYRGKQTGSFGRFGIFSFNGNKIITTSGGGMVVSNDEDAIKKMKFWATQAREPARHYEHKEVGYNYRMSNICAGIGRGQLRTLDNKIAAKKAVYEKYKDAFSQLPVKMMPVCDKGVPNYWLSVLTINSESGITPEQIIDLLDKENIESRPVWKPMHLQPVFRDYPFFSHFDAGSFSEDIFSRGVCLPSGSGMKDEEQEEIISLINYMFSSERSLREAAASKI